MRRARHERQTACGAKSNVAASNGDGALTDGGDIPPPAMIVGKNDIILLHRAENRSGTRSARPISMHKTPAAHRIADWANATSGAV